MANRLIFFTILVIVLLLYSCDTQPTQSTTNTNVYSPDAPSPLIFHSVPVPLLTNAHLFNLKGLDDDNESPYAMNFSTLAHTDHEDPYLYQRFELDYSDEILSEADGKTRLLRYSYSIALPNARKDARSDDDENVIIRGVNERIPDTDEAEALLREVTSIFRPGSHLHQILADDPNIDFSEFEDEDIVIVPEGTPCTVIIEPPSCHTQYFDGGESSFTQCFFKACSASSIDDPPPPYTPLPPPDLPPPGSDPGGGGSNPPDNSGGDGFLCDETLIDPPTECQEENDEEDEEIEPEPCDTGNETIDNPSFQNLMKQAANLSGFDNENQSERLEGFWVVYEENGVYTKELLPYAESGRTSCSFRISFGTVSVREQYLENAVYLLHTHPYAPGEAIHDTACHEAQRWDVETRGIPRYRPGPGEDDISHMNTMELPLVTIDTENIYSSAVGDTLPQQAEEYSRCF